MDRTARARDLRRHRPDAEARLWNALRARRLGGWYWKRQVPFGPYFLDFLCRDAALVIELDGGQHSEQVAYDTRRTVYLERNGLKVIRFWNFSVFEDMDGVCRTILDACGGEKTQEPSPSLRSARGRGVDSSSSPPRSERERVGRGPRRQPDRQHHQAAKKTGA